MNRSPLPRAPLGDDDSIPRIVNGAWQLSRDHRDRPPDRRQAVDDLLRLADLGLTSFDCADIYTGVESLLGAFLQAWRERGGDREAIRIHTKFVPDRGDLERVDGAYVERIIDRSLDRLGVERLDMVQYYWWDYEIPGWIEAARHLVRLRQAGKIRHIGVTNFDTTLLETLIDAGVPVVSNQVQYSLLDRRPERSLARVCGERGVTLLCYGTLAGGLLSSRWLGAPEPEGPMANRSLTKYRLIVDEFGGWPAYQRLLGVLEEIAGGRDAGIANCAVAWALSRPQVGAAILGARTAAHAAANLRAANLTLSPAELASIDAVLDAHPGPSGDVFGLERIPGGRHASIMKTNLNRVGDDGRRP